nr:hypothetical protein [Tanacetum cinerariifolium]
MAQNIDFSGSDQIQTPQYPDVHPSSQEISDEVFHAKGDLMKSIQTFLEEFNCIPFEEKATILLQAWFKFFAIKYDQPEDSNELFQKLLKDLKELAEYKESLENSSKEISTSNSNQEEEGPSQDSGIRQLIREERCIEVCKEQKQNMEDTILELVEICRQKELLCMHDNVDDLIESALNSKLLSINSQRLDKKEQEVKNVMEQPAERENRIIESLQNFRITLEDKRECDVPIYENSPVCDGHSDIFSDSNNNDDDISIDDNDFEDIEYVEASLSDPDIVSVEEENVVYQEEEEPDKERLINVVKNDISDDSSNDPLLKEADLFLTFDNSIPSGIENFVDDSKGDIRFLEELPINDSIRFSNNESSDFNFENNPSFPRPPPEPPDFKTDTGEEISVMINTIDELECLNPRDEFDDYFSLMFVIYLKLFSFLLSAESEDTIFDPGISV